MQMQVVRETGSDDKITQVVRETGLEDKITQTEQGYKTDDPDTTRRELSEEERKASQEPRKRPYGS